MSKEFDDVKEFHAKFGLLNGGQVRHLTHRKMKERLEFLLEELEEMAQASGYYLTDKEGEMKWEEIPGLDQDIEGISDALIDITYVAMGTAVMMGLPWDDLWNEVQRANMDKVRGVSHRGHAVDCVKPEGWVPPDIWGALFDAGYRPHGEKEFADDENV